MDSLEFSPTPSMGKKKCVPELPHAQLQEPLCSSLPTTPKGHHLHQLAPTGSPYQKSSYPHLTRRCQYESPYNNKDKYLSCHLRGNSIWFFTSDDSDIITSQQLEKQRQVNWGQRKKTERR